MRRAAALVLAIGIAAGCSSPSKGYSGDVKGAFLDACTRREAQPGPICTCVFDEIAAQIPFDRYEELDKEMQKDEKLVPDELIHIYADCSTRAAAASSQ